MDRSDRAEVALSEFRRLIRQFRFQHFSLSTGKRAELIQQIRKVANAARNHGVEQEEIERALIQELWRPLF